jgi:hypothetical protein
MKTTRIKIGEVVRNLIKMDLAQENRFGLSHEIGRSGDRKDETLPLMEIATSF